MYWAFGRTANKDEGIKLDLSDVSENIAMNAHRRKTRISKKNHSVGESGILKREYPSNPESMIAVYFIRISWILGLEYILSSPGLLQ